jgi:hypothetical protein
LQQWPSETKVFILPAGVAQWLSGKSRSLLSERPGFNPQVEQKKKEGGKEGGKRQMETLAWFHNLLHLPAAQAPAERKIWDLFFWCVVEVLNTWLNCSCLG